MSVDAAGSESFMRDEARVLLTLEVAPQRLADDELHLWQVDPTEFGIQVESLLELLSPAERSRAGAFQRAVDREQYTVTRGLLRRLLEAYGIASAADVCFEYSHQGKPRLAERHAGHRLEFNVSHTQGRSVLAFVRNGLLGVDVERCIELADRNELAVSCFSPREIAEYRSLAASDRLRGFYNAWTRKEAFIKATGEGLSRRLDSFSVVLSPGCEPRVLDVDGSADEAAAWTIYDPNQSRSDLSYALAVAMRSPPLRVIHRQFAAPTSIGLRRN